MLAAERMAPSVAGRTAPGLLRAELERVAAQQATADALQMIDVAPRVRGYTQRPKGGEHHGPS